ncbi:unnamed protein product [Ostreobium quekettii]|uniref:Uncharacterized protein n=1 Tax=Ostreobium quekettii TaxID=121088 RepID=A0A8S1JEN3_9CHLO|nr:unnamed protein product [Ostreobium quekettii]
MRHLGPPTTWVPKPQCEKGATECHLPQDPKSCVCLSQQSFPLRQQASSCRNTALSRLFNLHWAPGQLLAPSYQTMGLPQGPGSWCQQAGPSQTLPDSLQQVW